MLHIVNSLIRSSLEYGAPLFYDSPPSAVNTLEVSYNAAIRLATGLPMWTPVPVLRREAGVSSISSRLSLLTKLFLLRLLSSPPGLRLGDFAHQAVCTPSPFWKWWGKELGWRTRFDGGWTSLIHYQLLLAPSSGANELHDHFTRLGLLKYDPPKCSHC